MATGIIKELTNEEKTYYTATDVANLLGVSRDKAYRTIRTLREECIQEKGLSNSYPKGKIPKRFFNMKMMIG